MAQQAWALSVDEWEQMRRKLRAKVQYHLGNCCADKEDLVQETLARLQRALNTDQLRKPESVSSFVSGICNNVIAEYRRGVSRETAFDADVHEVGLSSPVANYLEMQGTLQAALDQLNGRDRCILTEFYLQEKGKDEICHSLGLTDAHFRVVIFRAKTRLRALLSVRAHPLPPPKPVHAVCLQP